MATGERLREERKRLKMTQAVFAERGGIGVSALKMYEGNEREAGSSFLTAIASEGADAQYILTGIRSNSALAADEQILLDGYRALDPATRKRMLAFILTESGPAEVSRQIKEKTSSAGKYKGAKIGSVTEGDFTGTVDIQVGGKRKT